MAHATKHSPIPGEDEIEPRQITKEPDQFAFGAVATMALLGSTVGAIAGAIIGAIYVAVSPIDASPWIIFFCFLLGGGIVGAVFAGLQTAGPFDHK
jgi:hypothetical protein